MVYKGKELYHFGIPGMHWGNRRYQNPDGTYTEEGKARRRKEYNYSEDYKRYSELKKKSNTEMSNKEMQDYLNRANLERQYAANHTSTGKAFIAKIGKQVLNMTAAGIAAYLFTKGKDFIKGKSK